MPTNSQVTPATNLEAFNWLVARTKQYGCANPYQVAYLVVHSTCLELTNGYQIAFLGNEWELAVRMAAEAERPGNNGVPTCYHNPRYVCPVCLPGCGGWAGKAELRSRMVPRAARR